MSSQTYYELLGIDREADATAIKKAFRKASLVHHPDRGGDPEKFKAISKAHETLSDPQKREIYNHYGEEGLRDFDSQSQMQIRLPPLGIRVHCHLSELYMGGKKSVEVERIVFSGNLHVRSSVKQTPHKETLTIDIPPQTIYGQKIVLKNQGHRHESDDDLVSDLILVITPMEEASEDPEASGYSLQELDVHYTLKLSLSEALIGFKRNLTYLDGQVIQLITSKVTPPETIKVIPKLGFKKDGLSPFGQVIKRQGDFYLHFEVEFPENLTEKQQKHIANAFGLPKIETSVIDANKTYKIDTLKTPQELHNHNHGNRGDPLSMMFGGGIPLGGMGIPMGMMGGIPMNMGGGGDDDDGGQPQCRQM